MKLTLLNPIAAQPISLHHPVQARFQSTRDYSIFHCSGREMLDVMNLEVVNDTDYTLPLPVELRWTCDNPKNLIVYLVQVSERADFQQILREVPSRQCQAEIWNLEMGKRYYWRVLLDGKIRVPQPDGSEKLERVISDTGTFEIAMEPPRWIRLPGCTNVRDCGGWMTRSGRRIRQGMFYRGSEFDRHHFLTPEGYEVLQSELKLRSDFDVRSGAEVPEDYSPVWEKRGLPVRWRHLPMAAYDQIGEERTRESYRRAFQLLGEPETYPAYCHCWGAADRGGTFCLMLGAALGMADEDLLLDYELTSCGIYGLRWRESENGKRLLAFLKKLAPEASSLGEQCLAYLHSCGITEEMLDAVRTILLE